MDEIEKPKPMGQVIQIDEARIRDHPTARQAIAKQSAERVARWCAALLKKH